MLIDRLVDIGVEAPDTEAFLVLTGDKGNMGSGGSGWDDWLSAWVHRLNERYGGEGSISCGRYGLVEIAMGSATEFRGN